MTKELFPAQEDPDLLSPCVPPQQSEWDSIQGCEIHY